MLCSEKKTHIAFSEFRSKRKTEINDGFRLAAVPARGILFEVLSAGCLVISSCYINNQKSFLK